MLDPLVGIRSAWWPLEERVQMLDGRIALAAPQQQEREAVVGAGEVRIQLEGPSIVADRLVMAIGLGERDRDVLQHPQIGRMVPEREPVRRQGSIVVALAFEGESLIEVVEALRCHRVIPAKSEEAFPVHPGVKIMRSRAPA